MRLFNKRSIPHTEEEAQFLYATLPGFQGLGSNQSGTMRVLQNSDIFTAIMMIASDLAKMDIHTHKEGRRDESPNSHKLEVLMNKRPNEYYDGYLFKLVVIANAFLTKHGYVRIIRDTNGQPAKLYHLKTSEVELKEESGRELYYKYKDEEIPFHDVVDYKPYSLDGINGLSMLESLEPDLDMQQQSKTFFANFFRNGTQTGGTLKLHNAQLSKEAREKVRDEFQKANAGTDQAGKVLVLDETMDYRQFEIDTEILRLINTSKHSTSQVAKVFGIPLHKFGMEVANMSLKDSMADYLQTTLSKYMQGLTSAFEFKLFKDNSRELVFDTEAYRKADWETYIESAREDYTAGLITLNEFRLKAGYSTVDEEYANKHRVSLNQVNGEIVDEYQKATMDNRLKQSESVTGEE